MREKIKAIRQWFPFVLLFIVLISATAAMFLQVLRYDTGHTREEDALYPIAIKGIYSEEGGTWNPLSKETKFDYKELRDITVRGHFTRDIPKGEKLFFNICQLQVTLHVNGAEVFCFGPREGDGNPTQSIGNQWVTITSPGISTTDEVELQFGNLYRNAYFIQFDNLLWHMYTGSEKAMLSQAVHKDAGLLVMGTVFLVLTLFLIIAGILLAILRIQGAARFFCLGLCTFFSAAWFITLTPALSLFIPLPVFLNTVYAYAIQGITASIILFVSTSLSGLRKKVILCALGVLMAFILAAIGLQMTGTTDLFSTIDYFSMMDAVIAMLLICCLIYEIRVLNNTKLIPFLKTMLPLVALGILEMFNGMVQWVEAGICFGLGLFLFALLQGYFILHRIRQSQENEKKAMVMENELTQNRIVIMLSQIQPHFLYNSLLGIKELCDTRPQKASDALEHFSYFLRGNLDALTNTALIPFDKELEHVEDYLYLEKMRYEERIVIRWDITYKNFLLPPLTLQPIVENAVRHGITPKSGGGTLTIRSEQTTDSVMITVQDDGVGFDAGELTDEGSTHVGIQNARNRLEIMCGGRIRIQSEKGIGTEVKIILPQGREQADENYSG